MSLILSGTDGLSDVDGSAATPAIRGTDANTGIFFPAADTIAFSEGGAEAMRITSAGDVGIGTSSPSVLLSVSKDGGSGDAGQLGRFTDTNTANSVGPTSLTIGMMNHFAANPRMSIAGTTGLSFCVGDGSNFATQRKVEIDSSGNLLVGTTTTVTGAIVNISNGTQQFQFGNGLGPSSAFAAYFNFVGNGVGSQVGATASIAHYQFYNPNGAVGSIVTSGSGTTYNTSSDYRLKENIAPMTGALSVVEQLKPVTYTWKVDGANGQGFIAHELQAVVPDCVTGEKDAVDADGNPQYQGIDTSFLVATLTAAIQEQQALITTLTDRITALETPTGTQA
jgi:hypothetical protein